MGTSIARKIGFQKSKTDIIMFFDSDDEILLNPYLFINKYTIEDHYDLLESKAVDNFDILFSSKNYCKVLDSNLLKLFFMGHNIIKYPLWLRVFDKKNLKATFFTNHHAIREDTFILPCILQEVSRAIYIDEYLVRYNKITKKKRIINKLLKNESSQDFESTYYNHLMKNLNEHVLKSDYFDRYIIQIFIKLCLNKSSKQLLRYRNLTKKHLKRRTLFNFSLGTHYDDIFVNNLIYFLGLKLTSKLFRIVYYLKSIGYKNDQKRV